MTNEEIAEQIKYLGKLMDLHDENPFKSKAFAAASFQIDKCKTELEEMSDDAIVRIPSVGKSMLNIIHELIETETIEELEVLLEKTPKGLLEMMQIKGLGPKKIRTIWKELEIESVGELLYACNENRLVELKGFGDKTQHEVIKQIQFINQSQHKFFYSEGLIVVEELLNLLQTKFSEAQFDCSGEIRRKEIVLDKIELIGILDFADKNEVIELLKSNLHFKLERDDESIIGKFAERFPVEIFLVKKEDYVLQQFHKTSSKKHLEQLPKVYESKIYLSEKDIYADYQMQFIEPELRNGLQEIELAKQNKLPILIEEKDIKGVIHCHSKYSDGKTTIKEMAEYCIQQGFEYLCMSDHSQSATYADGIKPDKIYQQHDEIDGLNKKLFPFKIFKGIESDILYNGDLDYENEVLSSFDFVIASVHSVLKMSEETAMKRVLKAIENPYTTILGHPTGRLLLSREGYPLDHKKIIDACAANNVVIELNANPHRLDIDWQWIPYALKKNVLISVNPDAHNLQGIHDIKYGIAASRTGMLSASNCLINMDVRQIEKYFSEKRK